MSCTILAYYLRNPEFSISNSEFLSIQERLSHLKKISWVYLSITRVLLNHRTLTLFFKSWCKKHVKQKISDIASGQPVLLLLMFCEDFSWKLNSAISIPTRALSTIASVPCIESSSNQHLRRETFFSVWGEMNNFDSMVRCSITRPPNSNVVIIAIAILGLFFAQCCNCSSFPSHPFPNRAGKHFCFKLPLPEPVTQQFSILP